MKNTKDSKKNDLNSKSETKEQKTPPTKFGVLGKDLSSKFSSRGGNRVFKPTKPGGRNGQGKP